MDEETVSALFSPYVTSPQPRFLPPGPISLMGNRNTINHPDKQIEPYLRALVNPPSASGMDKAIEAFPPISHPVNVNAQNWDKFIQGTEPSNNIEDRRQEGQIPGQQIAATILGMLKSGQSVDSENKDWLLDHGYTNEFLNATSPSRNRPPDSIGDLLEGLRRGR